jgi:hypothetical protein
LSERRYRSDYSPHDRVPVQGEGSWWLSQRDPRRVGAKCPGSIEWWEHVEAWKGYDKLYPGQPAHVVAGRGGFGWLELIDFLGHEPTTWRDRD